MREYVRLLDCTLRDGAYIVDANFGTPSIKGIIKKMEDANVDIIECGWLKNTPHKTGTTFFHLPQDIEQYLIEKKQKSTYVAMIDWDRYDLEQLPEYDGKSIDAIRVVFPKNKFREGIALGKKIEEKGYKVYFQAANTLGYLDEELLQLAQEVNKAKPEALSIVDTFGAMYWDDLERIITLLNNNLDKEIKLGFHSHNNQQLSFSLSMQFVENLADSGRSVIVDSSLCGMGRGAGNATTELMANYLNLKHHGKYDMNMIMDAIDMYMEYFKENYSWGYSTPYFIAGMYCCHVNNISYLQRNHRTNAKDMHNIIETLAPEERRKYDYDLLEDIYLKNQDRKVNDEDVFKKLYEALHDKQVLLIAPGKSTQKQSAKIKKFIERENPVTIAVNAITPEYRMDYFFVINTIRYNYAKEVYAKEFAAPQKILLSNVKTQPDEKEMIVNFNHIVKRGWKYFDNAVINCLRLLDKLEVENVAIAGFDGFQNHYNDSYADASLPTLNPDNQWEELNHEIKNMFRDFKQTVKTEMNIQFITKSIFDEEE